MAITKTVFDVVKDSIKPYIDLNAGNIAAVEKTSTAAAAHLAGTQIVFKGKLYDVIQDIAQNGTIIVGTNIVAADSLSSDIATLSNLVEGATEITTKSYAPIIAVTDALPVNAVDVSAKIEPIQAGSGTPSPSNVRAISGRTEVTVTRAGKNLVEETIARSNVDSTGVIVGNDNSYDLYIAKVKKDVTYSLGLGSSMYVYGFFTNKPTIGARTYDGNRVVVNNTPTFIAPIDGYIAFRSPSGFTEPSIVIGNTSATYEAPNVNDYTIQLGDTYYGGTLDVTTGKLTVDRIYKEYDGTETWTENTNYSNMFYTSYPSGVSNDYSQNQEKGLCNSYVITNRPQQGLQPFDNTYWMGANLNIYDTVNCTSLADWTAYVTANHLQFVFPLATPQVIQLTPQEIQMLQGNSTIFTDSGDTSVSYYANGVKNLETVVAEMQTDKAEKSDLASISITGTTNNTGSTISAGKYFYLNGTLVRAKVSIASNATLTLNTNYEVVTAGALNELIVFNNRGNVSSSSLENYTQAGIFQVYATDVLAEGWGILIVTTDNAVVTQTLINGVGIAFRKYSANQSAWSTWTKTLFS